MTTYFGKELFIRFTASAFVKLPSICVFGCFPFGFGGGLWGLIVSVPDHSLSFYFGFMVQCFLLESNSLLLKNVFFLSFVLWKL